MLQETTDELLGIELQCPPLMAAAVLITETNSATVDREDTAVERYHISLYRIA
jgi:hypothetical protein